MVLPLLDSPLPTPDRFTLSHQPTVFISSTSATIRATLSQGVYGDEPARVFVALGKTDGGTNSALWEQQIWVGLNTRFNAVVFSTTVTNLTPGTGYFYRFGASNLFDLEWIPTTSAFKTAEREPRPN